MIARARLAVAFAVAVLLAAVPGGPLGATEPMRIAGQTLEAGQYRIGTMTPTCGGARTFLSRELRDYGASVPGTIVLNPQRLSPLPVATQAFVYAHECGHQIYGASEPAADCHAARSGAREGWLNHPRLPGGGRPSGAVRGNQILRGGAPAYSGPVAGTRRRA